MENGSRKVRDLHWRVIARSANQAESRDYAGRQRLANLESSRLAQTNRSNSRSDADGAKIARSSGRNHPKKMAASSGYADLTPRQFASSQRLRFVRNAPERTRNLGPGAAVGRTTAALKIFRSGRPGTGCSRRTSLRQSHCPDSITRQWTATLSAPKTR